jgi:CheY-like chemotaxis protein
VLLQNRRIFVIEDNLENRFITRVILTEQGAHVEFDRWGRNVIKALHAFAPIDVILLDLMFPNGVTGFAVFDEIRKVPEFESVPIVAVSATDPSAAIPQAKQKGFAGFIAKPVDADLFPQQIARILNHEPVWHKG